MNPGSLRNTSLPVNDPQALWHALQGQVDPKELERVDSTTRSVHAHVLSLFMKATCDEKARLLRDCCLQLIQLKAPITDAYGSGAAAQFCGYAWPTVREQVDLVAGLADAYRSAGYWDIEQPLDGDNYDGLKPLAVAIFGSNPELARYLCERGTSLELGVKFAGEPPAHAIDLAREEDEGEIHAVLVEAAMKRRLAAEPSADFSAAPRRHRRTSL